MPPASNFGFSIDIGTTHITIHLVRLSDLHVANEHVVQNPQVHYGSDIISRIEYAVKKKENEERLTSLVRSAVQDGIATILKQNHFKPTLVTQVVIVGNTVMHHLFFGLSVSSLSKAPYTADDKDAVKIHAIDAGIPLLNDTECYSPPIVESFIGADAPAVLLASGFLESNINHIAVDVGTNTEIAVKSSQGIWIASAASGPAFEGMSSECGMPGDIGAISDVEIDKRTLQPNIEVMGGGKPRGICGTGTISALAAMLNRNILLPRGSFNRNITSRWLSLDSSIAYYVLADNKVSAIGHPIVISQPDIRMLQQSKAAVRAVLDILLDHAHVRAEEIESFYLTGIFGSGLQIEDAYRIGMFPILSNARITQFGKGASLGADLLMIPEKRREIEDLVAQLKYIEMSDNPAFWAQYFNSIPFPD